MPVPIDTYPESSPSFEGKDYGYEYPNGLDLRPGSPLHGSIVRKIMDRAQDSWRTISTRHDSWRKVNETLSCFIPTDKKILDRLGQDESSPLLMVVPISRAVLDTIVTQWCQSLLQEPMIPLQGVGPEDTYGAILMEMLLQIQAVQNKFALQLHTQIRDAISLGVGISAVQWEVKTRQREIPVNPMQAMLNAILGRAPAPSYTNEVYFEGNRLSNVDPFTFLPEPNCAIENLDRAEYVAWRSRENLMNLLSAEQNGVEGLFNVQAVKELKPATSTLFRAQDTGRNSRDADETWSSGLGRSNPVDVITMFIKLIPADWKLGANRYPERWMFEIAGDRILINARRCMDRHGMFPVTAIAPDFDGYTTTPISTLESIYGLQITEDFLINSHIYNIEKTNSSMLIADPGMVNVKSLESPEPGKVILTAEEYWGRGVGDAVHQLQFFDVTRSNVSDAGFVNDIIQRVTGAANNLQGMIEPGGERRTATEVGGARAASLSRVHSGISMGQVQCIYDLGRICGGNLQQHMTKQQYLRTAGRWEDTLRSEYGVTDPYVLVDPRMIDVAFDVIPRSASIPGGTNVQGFLQWLQFVGSNPTTAQRIDMLRASLHVARELGVGNVEDFIVKHPVMPIPIPTEQVQDAAQRGDLQPVPEGGTPWTP